MKVGLFDHIEHGERPTSQLYDERLTFIQAADEARIRARLGDVSRTWDEDVLSAAAAAGAGCAAHCSAPSTAS